jgi:DNA-binding transcriptional MerR regulator
MPIAAINDSHAEAGRAAARDEFMTDGPSQAPGPEEKGSFRIGEVSRLTGTKAFVLRYWETEFPMLQPVKSVNGHRLYRRADIETVFEIKRLLYEQGFTIAGARRYLAERNGGESAVTAGGPQSPCDSSSHDGSAVRNAHITAAQRRLLLNLREELAAVLTLLKAR